jgi:hypothetical protein
VLDALELIENLIVVMLVHGDALRQSLNISRRKWLILASAAAARCAGGGECRGEGRDDEKCCERVSHGVRLFDAQRCGSLASVSDAALNVIRFAPSELQRYSKGCSGRQKATGASASSITCELWYAQGTASILKA